MVLVSRDVQSFKADECHGSARDFVASEASIDEALQGLRFF